MTEERQNYVRQTDLGNNGILFYEKIKPLYNSKMVDLGVRYGVSSSIMLEDSFIKNNYVYGVDVVNTVDPGVLNHSRYKLLVTDSITAAKNWSEGSIDVLFVDTLHIKEQVLNELYYWMPFVKENGLVVFHDTNWPQDKFDHYKGKYWDRPEEAVKAYFNTTDLNTENDFFTASHYPESWGMTFIQLKKKSDSFGKNVDWETTHKFLTL